MHAANKAVVLAEAKMFLKEHPEFLHHVGRFTLNIRVLSAGKTLTCSGPSAVEPRSLVRCKGSRKPRA
jgi:hypothetical protein